MFTLCPWDPGSSYFFLGRKALVALKAANDSAFLGYLKQFSVLCQFSSPHIVQMMSAGRPPDHAGAGVYDSGSGVRPPAVAVRCANKSSFCLRWSRNSFIKRVVCSTGVVIAATANSAADSAAAVVRSASSSSKSAI